MNEFTMLILEQGNTGKRKAYLHDGHRLYAEVDIEDEEVVSDVHVCELEAPC